ncbi:MAG: hypothetical protein PVF83_13965 [Anaerolineales bacterium]
MGWSQHIAVWGAQRGSSLQPGARSPHDRGCGRQREPDVADLSRRRQHHHRSGEWR